MFGFILFSLSVLPTASYNRLQLLHPLRDLLMRWLIGLLASIAFVGVSFSAANAANKKLLLVTHSTGFVHDSVGVAEDVLKELGPQNGYDVTCFRFTGDPTAKVKYKPKKDGPEVETTALEKYSAEFRARTGKTVEQEHCGRLNKQTLKDFQAVLFFTTGSPMTAEEFKDFQDWVKGGGAFAGTHCASDTLYNIAAYGDLIGGYFKTHPPGFQKIKLLVEDPKHPAAAKMTANMPYEDEIYIFRDQPYSRDRLHIILSCVPGSFAPEKGGRSDGDYAIAWCREEGRGKIFYTALGHRKEVWNDAVFQAHLFGGLDWATGQKPGDATPTAKINAK
jgi:uncharacterized protein